MADSPTGLPNGQFMGSIPYTQPAQYGVPPPSGATEIQGTGGHPSKGAGLISGIQAGQNIADKYIQGQRGTIDWNQQQAARKANQSSTAADLNETDPNESQAHQSFLSSLGTAMQHMGAGVANYFGGGKGAIPGPGAAPNAPGNLQPQMGQAGAAPNSGAPGAVPAPFNPAQASASLAAPQAMASGGAVNALGSIASAATAAGYAAGGPVYPDFMTDGGQVLPASTQGQMLPMAEGGAVPGGNNPMVSPQAIAAAPGPAPQLADNQPAGQPGDPGAAVPGPNQVNPSNQMLPHTKAIEDFSQHLQDYALNDAGVPNGKAALPAPGVQGAASQADNPAAAKGIPEEKPAHSLSPDYWDKSDHMMAQAAISAAAAGHDPHEVYGALSNLRTTFIQGHILRNLASANVALQDGDQKGVETALRNVNYYLPNGQDLTMQKGANGQLTYQNPITPYVDSKGQPTQQDTDPSTGQKNQPNIIPVDAAHIQMLGQAALDPMGVNGLIVAARNAGVEQQLKQSQARAAEVTAQGTYLRGAGIQAEGQSHLNRDASQNVKDLSEAQLAQRRGLWLDGQTKNAAKQDPSVLPGAQDAARAVQDEAQGVTTTQPAVDASGNPSLSPNAGKPMRDPNRVPAFYKNAAPEVVFGAAARASQLYVANRGDGMTPQGAAEVSRNIGEQQGRMHQEGGKAVPNVAMDKSGGFGHVWIPQRDQKGKEVGGSWKAFRTAPDTAQNISTGNLSAPTADNMLATQDAMGGGGGQAIPAPAQSAAMANDMNPNSEG